LRIAKIGNRRVRLGTRKWSPPSILERDSDEYKKLSESIESVFRQRFSWHDKAPVERFLIVDWFVSLAALITEERMPKQRYSEKQREVQEEARLVTNKELRSLAASLRKVSLKFDRLDESAAAALNSSGLVPDNARSMLDAMRGAVTRGITRGRRGRPQSTVLQQILINRLAEVYFDETGRDPGISFLWKEGRVSGPFYRLASQLLAAMNLADIKLEYIIRRTRSVWKTTYYGAKSLQKSPRLKSM
jgi:hypothetical protein